MSRRAVDCFSLWRTANTLLYSLNAGGCMLCSECLDQWLVVKRLPLFRQPELCVIFRLAQQTSTSRDKSNIAISQIITLSKKKDLLRRNETVGSR